MHPVQHFKDNFNQPANEANTADNQVENNTDSIQIYADDSHVRNLCFVWPDGRKIFFNYAYLVTCEYQPGDNLNSIVLGFSSHKVILQGYGLKKLFTELLDHLPRYIHQVDPRYAQTEKAKTAVVTIINFEVESNN